MNAFKKVLAVVLVFALAAALGACGGEKSFVTPIFGTRALAADEFSEVVLGCVDYESLKPFFARIDISQENFSLTALSDYSCTLERGFNKKTNGFDKSFTVFLGDVSVYAEQGNIISADGGTSFYRLADQLCAITFYGEKTGVAVIADIPSDGDENSVFADVAALAGHISLCGELDSGVEVTAYSADEVSFFNGWHISGLSQLFWDSASCYFVASSGGVPIAAVTAYICTDAEVQAAKSAFEKSGTLLPVYNEKGNEIGFTSAESTSGDNSCAYYIKSGGKYVYVFINASGVIDAHNWQQTEKFLTGKQ